MSYGQRVALLDDDQLLTEWYELTTVSEVGRLPYDVKDLEDGIS